MITDDKFQLVAMPKHKVSHCLSLRFWKWCGSSICQKTRILVIIKEMGKIWPWDVVVAVKIYPLCLFAAGRVSWPCVFPLKDNIFTKVRCVFFLFDVIKSVNIQNWHDIELDASRQIKRFSISMMNAMELLKQNTEDHLYGGYFSCVV